MRKRQLEGTIEKYLTVLEEMYVLETFHGVEVCKKYSANRGIPAALLRLKLVEKQGYSKGTYKWIGGTPTRKTVEAVCEVISQIGAAYLQMKKARNISSTQLVVEPAPTPVEDPFKAVKTPVTGPFQPRPVPSLFPKETVRFSDADSEAISAAVELAVKLGKKDVGKFVTQILNAE